MNSGERGLGGVIFALSMATGGCNAGAGVLVGTGGVGVVTTGAGGQSVVVGTGGGAGAAPTGTAGIGDSPCGRPPQHALPVTPSIMIVLDTSASMNDPIDLSCPNGCGVQSKWAAAVDGINSEVDATSARVGWGLAFISGTKAACAPDLGSLVGGGSVKLALANRTSAGSLTVPGSRPTRAAIDLAARSLAAESGPGRVIVLITDGSPGCKAGDSDVLASDTTDTLSAVTTAFGAGVPTFVVGLGTWNGPADRDLSDIAIYGGLSRGGSPAYNPASSSGDVVIALNALVTAMDCFFLLPPPYGGDFTVIAGGLAIPQDSLNGWAYTDASLTAIRVQGTGCDTVRGSGLDVDIAFHCPIP